MRIQVGVTYGSYTFDTSTRTIVISGVGSSSMGLDEILAVIHPGSGAVLYQIGSAALKATFTPAAGGGTLVLNASVSMVGLNNSDPLTIMVDADVAPALPTGAATAANQTSGNASLTQIDTDLGALTETAPATDTASSGLNGRLQRIAQRLTALIAQLPASLGIKTAAASLSVAPASDAVFSAGGVTVNQVVAPAVTAASAYATGNCVGGKLTIANAARVAGGSGVIQNVTIRSKSAQTAQMDLLIFYADPTGTTVTDKTAVAVAAADFDKCLGVITLTAWTSMGTPSVAQSVAVSMPFTVASGTSLYGILVTRGTPTFTATSDLSVRISIFQD